MSIIIQEAVESGSTTLGESPTVDLVWFCNGSNSRLEIGAALADVVPQTVFADSNGDKILVLKSLVWDIVGWLTWKATARYGNATKQEPKQTGDSSFNFEIGTETTHITQSLATAKYSTAKVATATPANVEIGDVFELDYNGHVFQFVATQANVANVTAGLTAAWNAGGDWVNGIVAKDNTTNLTLTAPNSTVDFSVTGSATNGSGANTQTLTVTVTTPGGIAPDYKGAIGVTKDGVSGCDILEVSTSFSETHYLPIATVTPLYKSLIASVVGKVNIAPFKGFPAGEVLCLGASGGQRGAEDWELSFKFARHPNQTGLTIGPFTGIDKTGWQYIWVRYKEYEDTVSKSLVRQPQAVYVETVYYSADFSLLGIGV